MLAQSDPISDSSEINGFIKLQKFSLACGSIVSMAAVVLSAIQGNDYAFAISLAYMVESSLFWFGRFRTKFISNLHTYVTVFLILYTIGIALGVMAYVVQKVHEMSIAVVYFLPSLMLYTIVLLLETLIITKRQLLYEISLSVV